MLPLLPPLLAFGFGHLAMLGWLGVAIAPLIIHLWNRRKHREVPWAAVQFLLAALEKNARRIRLQEWLLLAVRTCIMVLVALAVAEPFTERLGFSFAPSVRTHRMFVLDGSYSMAYRPADASLFVRAKRLIGEIVDASNQGDVFTMVLLADPPRAIVSRPTFSKSDFLAELEGILLPDGGGDLVATLRMATDILREVQREQPALDHHEVYFVTDLGRSTWQADAGTDASSHESSRRRSTGVSQSAWERLLRLAEPIVVDVGLDDAQNIAVTNITARESFAVVGRDGVFETVVRNFDTQPKSGCFLQFLVDNVPIEDRRIDVPGGSEKTVRFVHRFSKPGSHVVTARLPSDLLNIDDVRWLAVQVQQHLRVLCVEGKHHAARYVSDALAPERSSSALIEVQKVHESEFVELDTSAFDCIFFCNIGQLTSGEVEEIDRYLQRGGGIVFFLGDLVIPERINRSLATERNPDPSALDGGSDADRIPLLPVQIGELVPEGLYPLDPLEYRHPIVQPFQGRESAGLLSTPIYRYFRLELLPEARADVALAFRGGDPAIVLAPVHRGHVAVVATAGSLASIDAITKNPWTVWPVWPSFLPVVRGLLDQTIGGHRDLQNVRVGQPFGEIVSGYHVPKGDKVKVTRPDGATHVVRLRNESDHVGWTFDETDRAGIYHVVGEGMPDTGTPFAVNVDTTESDLTKAAGVDLPRQLAVHKTWAGFNEPVPLHAIRPYPMHRTLIYLVILLVFLESYIAWSFGKVVA